MGKLNPISQFLIFQSQLPEMKFMNLIMSLSHFKSFYKNAHFQGPSLKIQIQIPSFAHGSVLKFLGTSAVQGSLKPLLKKILPRDLLPLVCFSFHSDPALCDDYHIFSNPEKNAQGPVDLLIIQVHTDSDNVEAAPLDSWASPQYTEYFRAGEEKQA